MALSYSISVEYPDISDSRPPAQRKAKSRHRSYWRRGAAGATSIILARA